MAKKKLISLDDLDKFKVSPKDEGSKRALKKKDVERRQAEIRERKLKKSRRGCGCSRARKREQSG
jgi:hypothetical protein